MIDAGLKPVRMMDLSFLMYSMQFGVYGMVVLNGAKSHSQYPRLDSIVRSRA